MVKLSLLSPKGNAARFFPHQGFLALTPIKLEGIVRTRLDDDRKFLQASDLFVALRCYEARLGRTGVQHTNLLVDHRVPLWSKPPDQPWADLGDGDWPFRLILPTSLPGHSTAHFQEYRVFWRIEAVLNHIPIVGVGHRQIKSFDLPLTRYDPGQSLPSPSSAWHIIHSTKLDTTLRYLINSPPFPLGPMDLVTVSLKLAPSQPHIRVSTLALAVERRLDFNDPPPKDSPDRSSPPASKSVTFLVASADTSDIPRDDHGIYAKTVTLQMPTQKSSSHWAVGETMHTTLVTLRFFLHVKVTLSHPANGSTETLSLTPPRELCVISTNDSQRRLAMAEAARRGIPLSSPVKLPKTPRRPHTSSGGGGGGVGTVVTRKTARMRGGMSHPGSADGEEDRERKRMSGGVVDSAPAVRTMFDGGVGGGPTMAEEWEEELEKIVAQSRRRSVGMLGFGDRRTRVRLDR